MKPTKEEIFAKIKFEIAKIQFNYLKLSTDKQHIEANPSTHRIALYVCDLLNDCEKEVADAIEQFHKEKMREELKAFLIWYVSPPAITLILQSNADEDTILCEYLNTLNTK